MRMPVIQEERGNDTGWVVEEERRRAINGVRKGKRRGQNSWWNSVTMIQQAGLCSLFHQPTTDTDKPTSAYPLASTHQRLSQLNQLTWWDGEDEGAPMSGGYQVLERHTILQGWEENVAEGVRGECGGCDFEVSSGRGWNEF
jgi:hypothetical protein